MQNIILRAVLVATFVANTAHFALAQTVLSDTTVSGGYVFSGQYILSGDIVFDANSDLHFSSGTNFLISDSTYISVLGHISYASDYDSVSVRSQESGLSSVEFHFEGQAEDSIELRNWSVSDLLLEAQDVYPDSLAVFNFRNYRELIFKNVKVSKSGVIQVDDNAITNTFGAVMMDNIERISIGNSIFSECQSSSTGGALTVCNSDSIFLGSSRFYKNIAIDSAEGGGRIIYTGQGASSSIDISNKYLEVSKCVFAFNRKTITTAYFSANNTIVDGCIFYDNLRNDLLSQASISNVTTIRSSSFIDCEAGVVGGRNIVLEDCIIKNKFQPRSLDPYGYAMNYSIGVPRFESRNVYFYSGSICFRCGDGFIPYDNFEDVLDTLSISQIDGYSFLGVFPSLVGLLVDESSQPCSSSELDVLLGTRCIGSAPDIGAIERQQTVAVEEVDVATDFTLYPNPTSAHLYVSTAQAWEVKKATLTDLSGRQWPLQIDRIDEYTNLLLLPTGLRAGAYVVKVFDATGSPRTGKVIISHNW
ncbi:MAG: T9SS type A sorting domain-containing protein [Saprospiraceae bacterium]